MTETTTSNQSAATALIGLLAETHVHVGVGQSVEAIDLPVAREKPAHYPFVPGSGVKGAFNIWAREPKTGLENQAISLFGNEGEDDGSDQNAGGLRCSDARLLLLPVRAMSGAYRWATCPGILRRFQRDAERCETAVEPIDAVSVKKTGYLGIGQSGSWLGLEEREFEWQGGIDDAVFNALGPAVPLASMAATLKDKLVILNDDDFAWFAMYGLPVMARNRLDDNKRVIRGQLWYEESLPPDTVLYLTFGERTPGTVNSVLSAAESSRYIQMGGNETIGQGWFLMAPYGRDASTGRKNVGKTA